MVKREENEVQKLEIECKILEHQVQLNQTKDESKKSKINHKIEDLNNKKKLVDIKIVQLMMDTMAFLPKEL